MGISSKYLKRTFNRDKVEGHYTKIRWLFNLWIWLTERKAGEHVLVMSNIRNGEKVLEVATGTGVLFERICRRNENGLNIGIDLTPGMLKHARDRKYLQQRQQNGFIRSSAFHLPFKEKRFDLIISTFMFDLLPEEKFDDILNEFRRVLKKNGRVTIASMTFGQKVVHRIWVWLARYFPNLLAGCRPISMLPFLKRAGFQQIQSREFSQNTFPSEVASGQLAEKI